MKENNIIKLRAHHLVNLANFVNEGKIKYKFNELLFGLYINHLFKRIVSNPNLKIKIVDSLDNICRACRWVGKDRESHCELATIEEHYQLNSIEKMYADMVGLEIGVIYDSNKLITKIKQSKDLQTCAELRNGNCYRFIELKMIDKYILKNK